MTLRSVLFLSPFVAGFVAWMLSGSPLPMTLSALALILSLPGKLVSKRESAHYFLRILFCALSIGLVFFQIRLFQNGLAMAINADLPIWYHLGLGLLWISLMETVAFREAPTRIHFFLGLSGSLMILASAYAVELYDFAPWQVYPLAALPAVLFLATTFLSGTPLPKVALAASLAAVGVTAFALSLEKGTDYADEWIRGKDARLDDYSSANRPQFDNGAGGPDGSSRRLPRKANIRFNDRYRIFLQTPSADLFRSWVHEPLYLRTSTVTVFESDELIAPVRSGRWIYDSDDGETDQSIPILASIPSSVHDYTLFIESEAAHALPLLNRTLSLSTSSLYEFADDWFQLAPNETVKRLCYSGKISASSEVALPTAPLLALERRDAPGIYLNLPPSPLAARVAGLCGRFPDEATIETLREFIRERAQYSLSYDTPENMSPVENLLFGQRLGHCELYAAASCMMLRSLGIPSRVAYGYSGGVADRAQQLIAFRDRDFHAWTEILTNENGWAVFDATPTGEISAQRSPEMSSLPATDWSSYENFSDGTLTEEVGSGSLLSLLTDLTSFLSRHFLSTIGVGLLLAGGIWWARNGTRSRKHTSISTSENPGRSPSASELMNQLHQCGSIIGETREAGQTWQEFLRKLQSREQLPGVFAEAIRYYYLIRYAGREPDPQIERELKNQLSAWKQARLTD
ncbi:MAG: transglutaminase-like domain-containing protein [Verrucomicrobiales bacterium]|nr:transglutaminase-like domain-containing protein [Verrucomicrobiales bacterium]